MGRKPRPANKIGRKRRAAGWTLLVLSLAVAGVWVASGWRQLLWSVGGVTVEARLGLLEVHTHWGADQIQFNLMKITDRRTYRWRVLWWHWRWRQWNGFVPYDTTTAPLWLPAVALWGGSLALMYSSERSLRARTNGHCTTCGYSLAGLAKDAPCPECGQGKPKAD